ncbi:hypothetical protein [Nocardia wallacei]|uniref:hypothetical protein n=1 Tax=Nocardia wallacei TaxID=480035 RepID=UPI002457A73A|nr:hypothetical protein [Nocardia wallacei]
MRTTRISGGSTGEVERRLLDIHSDVWWSPADSAYIAYSVDFPALVCSDPRSPLAAIDILEARILEKLRRGTPGAAH